MKLTAEQQRLLAGERGEMVQRLARLLVRLGDIYGAEEMVPIASAQVSGVSYKSIGDPGLDFLEDLAARGVETQVLTTSNPAGMDLEDWQALGFPADFAAKQRRIMAAFEKMGVLASATCTPYLAGNLPSFGEHLAWAESSAVSYANSVIGARTNREGGPSALAAAVCGFTPRYGLHLSENRRPDLIVAVDTELGEATDFAALGVHVGGLVENRIPYFRGIADADGDRLKALGAAMAASGAVALYHVEGVTPEAGGVVTHGLETIAVGRAELDAVRARLTTGEEPDLIVVGCPHASLDEIAEVAEALAGKRLRTRFWICTSRAVKARATEMGLTGTIRAAGGEVVADTCMVVAPIKQMGFTTTAVTSGKAACYLPGFCDQKVVFADLAELLRGASA